MLLSCCVLGSTFAIPYSVLTNVYGETWKQQPWVKNHTVQPKSSRTPPPPSIDLLTYTKSWLHVPRFHGIAMFGIPDTDRRVPGDAWSHRDAFVAELNETQQRATQAVLAQLRGPVGGAMLVLPCGMGKTVCALHVAHALHVRTLVLVHTNPLADQWVERIQTFLPGISVGRIQSNRFDTECDITIALVQTVLRRADRGLNQFGTVIVDEAHHMAAPWFSKVLYFLPARHVLGLSATPDRRDGLGFILPWLLGPVAFTGVRAPETVDVHVVHYRNLNTQREITTSYGKLRDAFMTTQLCKDTRRTTLLSEHIHKCAATGRRVIVLSDRTELLVALHDQLVSKPGVQSLCGYNPPKLKRARDTWISDIWTEVSPAALYTVGLATGGVHVLVRELNFKATVLLTTYPYAEEGVDIVALDTVVFATPRSRVEQAIGRILRPCDTKKNPLVIDFVDAFSIYLGMSRKRNLFYTNQNYKVSVTPQT